jgi:hypothetical protein
MTDMVRPLQGLERVLRYDAHIGKFFWLVDRPRRTKAGDEAGHLNKRGYVEIRYNHTTYRAHRVAWYLHYKEDAAKSGIDHINGERSDNRIENLRLATPGENAKNMRKREGTTSKYKGASWHKATGKWQAQIKVDGSNIYLGYFDNDWDAHLAYCKAAAEHHGDFANFG